MDFGGDWLMTRMDLGGVGVRIMFATDINNVALDGTGSNGPFAIAFAKRVREKATLDEVMTRVTSDVNAATGGAQNPWQSGSLLQTLYLAGKPAAPGQEPFRPPG